MSKFEFNSNETCSNAIGAVFKKATEYKEQRKVKCVLCNLLSFEIFDLNNKLIFQGNINSKQKSTNFANIVYKTKIGYVITNYTEHPIPCYAIA